MRRSRLSHFVMLTILALFLSLTHASLFISAQTVTQVHLQGQVRDTNGVGRQGRLTISTHQELTPDTAIDKKLAVLTTDSDGNYRVTVPVSDHYIVQVNPLERQRLDGFLFPDSFTDTWRRVARGDSAELTINLTVQPAGVLYLEGYGTGGQYYYLHHYPDPRAFALFPVDTPPVHTSVQALNHQLPVFPVATGSGEVPAILVPAQTGEAYTLWLGWMVPEIGTVMLEMDNGGEGFAPPADTVQRVNVVYEITRTELRKAHQKYTSRLAAGYVFTPAVGEWLDQGDQFFQEAKTLFEAGNRSRVAVSAYRALTPIIKAKEAMALEIAQQDILKFRLVPITIRVVGPDQQPLAGIQVDYRQLHHDFLLSAGAPLDGTWGGTSHKTSYKIGNYVKTIDMVRQAGFENLVAEHCQWGQVQPTADKAHFEYRGNMLLRRLQEDGFRTSCNGIWFTPFHPQVYPSFLNGMSYEQIKTASVNYVTNVVRRYGRGIQAWGVVNEPNFANAYNFTPEQMLELIRATVEAGKAANPESQMQVILGAPGLSWGESQPDKTSSPIGSISSYDYLRQMLDYGIKADAIGLQLYYGVVLMPLDLGTLSDLLDVYGADFDVPFYIEEMEYPSLESYPGLRTPSSYLVWHGGHTDATQAEYATALYTLLFSKPYVIGANWLMGSDLPAYLSESFRIGDGWIEQDGETLRPMAFALHDLFASWTTTGRGKTDAEGRLQFMGYAGNYEITLTGDGDGIYQQSAHFDQTEESEIILQFDERQVKADNRSAAQATLDKAEEALKWADSWGKTAGKVDAQMFFEKANTAFRGEDYQRALELGKLAVESVSIKVDGQPEDWAGIHPIYTAPRPYMAGTDNNRLRRAFSTIDDSYFYLMLEFDGTAPQMDYLFTLRLGSYSKGYRDRWSYAIHTTAMGLESLFLNEYDDTHFDTLKVLNPRSTLDVIYDQVVEFRIPLSSLEGEHKILIENYRETRYPEWIFTESITLGSVERRD